MTPYACNIVAIKFGLMVVKNILIVDSDAPRRQLHAFGLRCAGFAAEEAESTSSARLAISRSCPHLVLLFGGQLDLEMQDFVRVMRSDVVTCALPLVAMVERAGEFGPAAALEWGLDDYLLEPVSPEVFVARIHALLGLNRQRLPEAGLADLEVDHERGVIVRGRRSATLAPTERRLFELFLAHRDEVLPREFLLYRIWGGGGEVDGRAVDVSVCRLRRAFDRLGYEGILQTVRGKGYRLAASETADDESGVNGGDVQSRHGKFRIPDSTFR
jgi:DNA-binding response OmpR family regulator